MNQKNILDYFIKIKDKYKESSIKTEKEFLALANCCCNYNIPSYRNRRSYYLRNDYRLVLAYVASDLYFNDEERKSAQTLLRKIESF